MGSILRSIVTVARSLLVYILIFPLIVCWGVTTLLVALYVKLRGKEDSLLLAMVQQKYAQGMLWITKMPLRVIGAENRVNTPALYAANHVSLVDAVVLCAIINNYPAVWFLHISWIKKPIIGMILKQITVPVDVSHPARSAKSLLRVIKLTKNRENNLIIFPEGRRFADGKIHPFSPGVGLIARMTERPVVPVYMHNLHKLYPAGSILINWHLVTVVIGKPLFRLPDETDTAFTERIFSWFVAQEHAYNEQ